MDTKNLFKMGEVTKALGLTRRMLINYEELGLVTPAFKNGNQGFRYYSADNMVHIRLIRTLQKLGLSLSEIREYFNDTTHLEDQIDRLVLLRNQLDQCIAQLHLRQFEESSQEIYQVTLPEFNAFCRDFKTADLAEKTAQLRQTYIDALKHFPADNENRMCIQIPAGSDSEGTYIIPVLADAGLKDIRHFPQAAAICIYYRGPYENFPKVHERLMQYALDNNMTPHGYFRNIYMEGPPTHGTNKEAYVTQIALPIKFIET
ncbi:MAG: MerR family transcriptional regulator [Clostridia bacterium]|nr:MerR family transcriptional regulator [Clostridia bacterium]